MQNEGGAKIFAALVKAHGDIRAIGKDSTNPHFKNKYASLDAIVENVRPILAAHGLAVTQSSEAVGEGKALNVYTTLIHESGEFLTSCAYVPIAKQDAQGAGGALTYGRRYSIAALLALATEEDDDGNAASRAPARAQQARAPRAEPVAAQPVPDEATKYPVPKFIGLAENRVMEFGKSKGKQLATMLTDDLKELEGWLKKRTDKAHFAPLLADVKTVLADRALGTDDDSKMGRVHAAVAKEDARLPF